MRQFCLFILLTATIYGCELKLVHLFDMSGDYRGFFLFFYLNFFLFRGLSKLVGNLPFGGFIKINFFRPMENLC